MNAEIITTGTEILLGEIVDTNAAWLARRLRDLGINLYYKTTVGDNEERITAAMRQALGRSDLVLVTGGLGPTVDDVTRQAAARATGRELRLHEQCWADIQELFRRWGRRPGENNRRQAFLPDGALPVRNPVGTAPGFIVEVNRPGRDSALLVCLPGVPREMKHLMRKSVEPFLLQRMGGGRQVIKSRTLRTIGLGESSIDSRIADLMRGSNPTVGLSAHPGQVDVRITARAANEAEAEQMIAAVATEVRARLGNAIYGEGKVEIEEVVVAKLQAAGHKLALLETNSGGEIATRLQGVAGSAAVIASTAVVHSLAELAADAPSEVASAQAARWAAEHLLRQAKEANLALAVCGTLDSRAGLYGRPRGESYLALATADGLQETRLPVGGTNELARRWIGNAALNWLRLWINSHIDV